MQLLTLNEYFRRGTKVNARRASSIKLKPSSLSSAPGKTNHLTEDEQLTVDTPFGESKRPA
jgi:hypothetical protein